MGISFQPDAKAAGTFTCLRGSSHTFACSSSVESAFGEPSQNSWQCGGDADPISTRQVAERALAPDRPPIAALFGLPDCSGRQCGNAMAAEFVRGVLHGIHQADGALLLDLSENLDSQAASGEGILRYAGRLCGVDKHIDTATLKSILRYSPPVVFLIDLTAEPPHRDEKPGRREWCEAIGRFLLEYGSAVDGRHAAIVLLPNRHSFDGEKSIRSYFDRSPVAVEWYRTDPHRPDAAHPQDLWAEDYAIRHRTEDVATAQTEQTVDRRWIRDRLEGWMQEQHSGTVLFRGEPGTGKSYLQAELLPRWFSRPGDKLVVRGFKAVGGYDSLELVKSLCYEMLWQLGCDGHPGENSGEPTTDEMTRLQRWFERLLSAVGQRNLEYVVPASQEGRRRWERLGRLLIGIDALDEGRVEDSTWLTELIPPTLPESVYVVVTSRPGLIDALASRKNCLKLLLSHPDPLEKSPTEVWQSPPKDALRHDVRAYIERNLPRSDSEPDWIDLVAQAAQDNFLLAALITRQVCACLDEAPESVRAFIDDIIRAGAESLNAAFGTVFQEFWESAAAKVKDGQRSLLRSALGVLVIAAEPITLSGIRAGAGARQSLEQLQASIEVLKVSGLVEQNGVGRERTFRIGLQPFREYLRDIGPDGSPVPADVQDSHAKLGRWCLTWDDNRASEADRRYKLRHGLTHLIEAGEWKAVFNLLVGPPDGRNFEYLETRMEFDGGTHGLIEDFNRTIAASVDNRALAANKNMAMLLAFAQSFMREQHTFADAPARCFQQMYPRLAWYEQLRGTIGKWVDEVAARWPYRWLKVLNEPPNNTAMTVGPWNPHRVHAVAISPSGRLIAIGVGNDCLIYNLVTMVLQARIPHPCWVNVLLFYSGESRLLTADWDGTCRIIDVLFSKVLDHCNIEHKVEQIAATRDTNCVALVDCHGHVHLWQQGAEPQALECSCDLEDDPEFVNAAFSPDGSRVMAASYQGNVHIWDCRTRACVRSVKPQRGHEDLEDNLAYMDEHGDNWSPKVAFMPDGRGAVCSNVRDECRIVDLESGLSTGTLPDRCLGPIEVMSVSNNGRRLMAASVEPDCRVWDLQDPKLLQTLSPPGERVHQVALSEDGAWAVGATSKLVHVWRVDPRQDPLSHRVECPAHAADFSPDGVRIVAGLSGGETPGLALGMWTLDLRTRSQLLRGPRVSASIVRFTPSGQRVWAWTGDEAIFIWDSETGRLLRTITGVSRAYRFYLSPNGRYVVFGGDPEEDEFVHDMMSAPMWFWTGGIIEDGNDVTGMSEPENTGSKYCLDGVGYWFLDSDSEDLPRLIPYREWPDEPPSRWLDLGDGRAISEGGVFYDFGSRYANDFYVTDKSGGPVANLFGYMNVPKGTITSPDGRWEARVFEGRLELGEPRGHLKNYRTLWRDHQTNWSASGKDIVFSPDGSRLATALHDGTCRIWDVIAGETTHVFETGGYLHNLRFSPDGKRLVFVSNDRVMLCEIIG